MVGKKLLSQVSRLYKFEEGFEHAGIKNIGNTRCTIERVTIILLRDDIQLVITLTQYRTINTVETIR